MSGEALIAGPFHSVIEGNEEGAETAAQAVDGARRHRCRPVLAVGEERGGWSHLTWSSS